MNDLLVCEGGEVGRAAIWREQLRECYYQKALHRLRPKSGFDPRIMLALLEYWSSTNGFINFVTQTSIAHLPCDKFLTMPLPLIPETEQDRLGDVLDDLNSLISAVERIIVKKQAVKQGMMQQLLKGRPSREAFVPLGSVTSWLSGGTPNRSNPIYWSGAIPWISATSLKKLEVATSDQAVTPAAVAAGSTMAPLGSTLLLVRGSALHSEIRAALVTAPVCFNQDVKALVPSEKVVPKFLTHSIHGNADKLLRLVTSAGNTAGVLDTRVVKSFEVWIPNRTQQQQIVTVLDDVSDELAACESCLAKAKAVKQGMMQELLTGRTRLPGKESTA